MKIMVIGGEGQLGSDCTQVLKQKNDVISLDLEDVDIAFFSDIEKKIADFLPDIIINCAGYTHVDNCETERELAWAVNVKGAENMAVCVQKYGGLLLHISTDYVFNGRKKIPEPYVEDDELNPLSYYGMTKLEGERLVRASTDRHIILRTAWMYGVNGHNFLKTMLKLAIKNPKNEIKVVRDQYGSPTWSHRLVLQITKMIDKNCQGTYHASAEGYCSWYELAKYFLEKMGVPHAVVPCSSDAYPTPAIRPQNSILENRRLKKMDINIMAHWQDDLDRFIAGFREQLINEARA
jgi:dTDP-4-dehydrorhamnose reductase